MNYFKFYNSKQEMNLEKGNRGCLKKKILKKFENYIFAILKQPPILSIQNNFYQD